MMTNTVSLPDTPWTCDADLGQGEALRSTLKECRLESWGAWSERGLEVFRYAEAARVLRSREFLSPFGNLSARSGLKPEDGWIYYHLEKMLAGMAGPEHLRLKAILLEFFGPRAVEKWRPAVHDIVGRLIQAAEPGKPFDIAQNLCLVLPAFLFCRLIDRPDEDAAFLAKTSDEILKIFSQDPKNRESIIDAGRALKTYTEELIAQRRGSQADDLISFLVRKQESGHLTEEELTHNIAMILEASVDNTGNQFALTLMQLLQVPDRWQQIVANPTLIRQAISESIRVMPKVTTINRFVGEDTTFNDETVPQGTWISVSVLAAHLDTEGMSDAETFDLMRKPNSRGLLVFGGGAHMCLGMLLSMVELEEGLATLARLYPNMRLAGEPEWTLDARNCMVQHLPVHLQPMHTAEA